MISAYGAPAQTTRIHGRVRLPITSKACSAVRRAVLVALGATLLVLAAPRVAWAHPPGATVLALSPGKIFRDLARALARRSPGPPRRNGQPRGGKANHHRIHSETYGTGSITGAERDWGELTPAESAFARDLAQRGFHVRIIPRRRDKRTPDFLVDGVTIELKTLQSFGRRTLEKRLKDSLPQKPDVTIIDCRNVEANLESVRRQIRAVEVSKNVSLEGKVIVCPTDRSMYTRNSCHENVTNVILTSDTYDEDKLDALNALPWYRGERGLVACDYERDIRPGYAWYGGHKYLTMCIWIGAFSELDVVELLSAIRQIDWVEPESVRLYVSHGDRKRFTRIDWDTPGQPAGGTPTT